MFLERGEDGAVVDDLDLLKCYFLQIFESKLQL